MQIFVPKYRHNMPHMDSRLLDSMLVEVNEADLPNVIEFWESLDRFSELGTKTIRDFFLTNVKTVCDHGTRKHTLEPFLRRPHITAHGGSKNGAPHCSNIVLDAAYETGRQTAFHGFNFWYGGGESGLMGATMRGFTDALKEFGRKPDQYAIQIVPSPFVYGVKTANGMKPANEGLCRVTDAAIIMPDFVTRRELLDSRCTAAISCPGGTGTLDEGTDIITHIKTGIRHVRLYVLNTLIARYNEGYFEPFRRVIERAVDCGLESPQTFDHVYFKETVQDVFADLMPKLETRNATPDAIYAAYCKRHQVQPGIPRSKQAADFAPGN